MNRPQIITLELEDCSNSLLEYVENLERALAYESDWAEQALQSRKELKQRNAELEAQVENLRKTIAPVRELVDKLPEWEISYHKLLDDLENTLAMKPSQCLAEHNREVAVRAVKSFADDTCGSRRSDEEYG